MALPHLPTWKYIPYKLAVLIVLIINITLKADNQFALSYTDSLKLQLKNCKKNEEPKVLLDAAKHFQFINTDTSLILANKAFALALI